MTREVRCPMRECRRRIAIDELPAHPAEQPCLHFIAAWGEGRDGMAREVLFGLEGNREFVIRNLRPAEIEPSTIDGVAEQIASATYASGHVAGDTAVFGDAHERDALGRSLSALILGPHPLAGLTPGWRERP